MGSECGPRLALGRSRTYRPGVDDQPPLDGPAAALVAAAEAALPAWVERSVARLASAWLGAVPDEVAAAARDAGQRAGDEVGARLRRLLAFDVDQQTTNPLSVLRGAVRYPTEVLRAAGVPPVVRDEFDEARFPDDPYGLTPATWADLDPELQEPGVVWGAWKAKTVLERRQAEGRR